MAANLQSQLSYLPQHQQEWQHSMQQQQQLSFHFWHCQLSAASPKHSWDPENWTASGQRVTQSRAGRHSNAGVATEEGEKSNGEIHGEKAKTTGICEGEKVKDSSNGEGEKAKDTCDGEGEKAKETSNGEGEKSKDNSNGEGDKAKVTSNGDGESKKSGSDAASTKAVADCEKNDHANGEKIAADGEEANGEEATGDADFMQHVLNVNACILGPKASGVHVVAVRTRCYQESEAAACPIVCLDPASQRTLALAYEFVLDSQNAVAFELVEGDGPVWLTGLHQVRVHDAAAGAEGEGEGEGDGESESEGEVEEEDSEDEEEEEADASMESIEEEDEKEDNDDEDEAEPPRAKRAARAPPPAKANGEKQQRPVASPRRRGRPAAAAKK